MDHREGVEPSPSAWKADILAVKLPVDTQDTVEGFEPFLNLSSKNKSVIQNLLCCVLSLYIYYTKIFNFLQMFRRGGRPLLSSTSFTVGRALSSNQGYTAFKFHLETSLSIPGVSESHAVTKRSPCKHRARSVGGKTPYAASTDGTG